MDIKKILTDLKYRISVTPESDPEYKNAVSLFERLKRKYNIDESELNARKTREFTGHLKNKFILIQILGVVIGVDFTGNDEFNFKSFKYMDERKKNYFNFEVDLTDEEYLNVTKKYEYLIHVWDRKLNKIEEDLKKEKERRIEAARYYFLDKGNLLKKVSSTEEKYPSFSLGDLVRAAKYFDDVILPDSVLDNDKKQIENF